MKFYFNSFLLVTCSLLLFSCEEDDPKQANCQANLVCTEDFRTITLEVTDQNDEPVVFDEFYTFKDNRTRFSIEDDLRPNDGFYPVLNDTYRSEVSLEGTVLVFVGVIDGSNVVEHQMEIKDNCCHIELIAGDTSIQIEL